MICSKCKQPIEEGDAYRMYGSTYRHVDKIYDGCFEHWARTMINRKNSTDD